jgi:hypothetical protein
MIQGEEGKPGASMEDRRKQFGKGPGGISTTTKHVHSLYKRSAIGEQRLLVAVLFCRFLFARQPVKSVAAAVVGFLHHVPIFVFV